MAFLIILRPCTGYPNMSKRGCLTTLSGINTEGVTKT